MPTRARFEPRFTLSLVYLFGLAFVYSKLLAAPALLEVFRRLPPGPERDAAADAATREALQGRLWMALAAALVTVAALSWANALPGLRRRT
jgi:hypothetical protein